MIFAPTNIRTIERCESEEIMENESFPETPEPPDLCDVILDSGLKIEDVFIEIDSYHGNRTIRLYKKVHPIVDLTPWAYSYPTPFRIAYMGYEPVATLYTQNCVIIKKL